LEPWNLHKYTLYIEHARSEYKISANITNYNLFATFVSNQLIKANKTIAVEQTPRNSYHFEKILRNLHGSKVIHIVRDPRGVLLSQKNKWKRNKFGGNMTPKEKIRTFLNYNPILTSYIYDRTLNRIFKNAITEPNLFFTIKFENILSAPQETLPQLFEFVELQYNTNFVNVKHSSSSFVSNNEQGIDIKRATSWKENISRNEIFIVQLITKRIMNRYNYPRHSVSIINPFVFLYYFITLLIQSVFVIAFNYNFVRKFLENRFFTVLTYFTNK